MGGVDRLTAFLSYYCSGFRSSKWWLRLFYQLLDICIVNAFVISKQCTHTSTKWRTQKQFRIDLFEQLINNRTYRKHIGRPTTHNNNIPSNTQHFIGKHTTQKRCRVCGTKTMYVCKQCQCGLCIIDCFEQFHTC